MYTIIYCIFPNCTVYYVTGMSLKDGRGLSGVRSEAGGVQPQEPKKKFAEDGFMVKFVLSKAYRGLERQENEMGRPTLKLRHRRRHRRHHRQDGAGNQGDGHVPKEGAGDGEQAGRRRSVLDKARDRLRARTSHHRDMVSEAYIRVHFSKRAENYLQTRRDVDQVFI